MDPRQGVKAVRELDRAVTRLGLRGLKLAPNCQFFFPNDTEFYPLYEKCVELQVPVIFHSGTTVGYYRGWSEQPRRDGSQA